MEKRILKIVSDHFGVSEEDMKGKSRKRELVRARQYALMLIKQNTNLSLYATGRMLNRDHATVLHSIGVVTNSTDLYREDREIIMSLNDKIEPYKGHMDYEIKSSHHGKCERVRDIESEIASLESQIKEKPIRPIPKEVEFPNDNYKLDSTNTCNKVITEIEKCECGHIAPLGFIHWNQDGDSTCVNCVNDILIDRLGKKNKQIKSLKSKLNGSQINLKRKK